MAKKVCIFDLRLEIESRGLNVFNSDGGIHPFDPELAVPWPMEKSEILLSAKDEKLSQLSELNL